MEPLSHLAQLAVACARRGDFQQALNLAQRALATQGNDHGLMIFVGLLHSRQMELDKAIPHFRSAMRLAPRDPLPRLELARVLIGLNQLDEAETLLRSA